MDFKKLGNFNWIEMDSKVQNLDLTGTKRIHFCPFQFIFVRWDVHEVSIKNKFLICNKYVVHMLYMLYILLYMLYIK